MREILKRTDSRVAHCAIVDKPEYSYAQLPTGWQFEVAPLCSCGAEMDACVHADDSVTLSCDECYFDVWTPKYW